MIEAADTADTVTDLNNEGIGGVPALFKSFTQQAGLAGLLVVQVHFTSGVGVSEWLRDEPAWRAPRASSEHPGNRRARNRVTRRSARNR